ncbi:MAG: TorF family putative porin [Pseudomonadota bacterium]
MKRWATVLFFLALVVPSPLAAQWYGEASVTSDYRDRGVSYSGGDVAVQGLIERGFDSGLNLGVWASTLRQAPGGDAEVNIYASYGKDMGAVGFWSLGAQYVGFVGAPGTDYGEVFAAIGVDYGLAVASLGLSYTPSRNDIKAGGDLYTQARIDAHWPGRPYGASARLGYDRLEKLTDKWDWSLGLFYRWRAATLSLDYVDSARANAQVFARRGATIVGAVKLSF